MAIALEFINLIIPLEHVRRATGPRAKVILSQIQSGGGSIGPVEWHDDHLYVDASMGDYNVEDWVAEWEAMGLRATEILGGEKIWKDICVVKTNAGPTMPCEWLEYDHQNNCVSLRGQPRGLLVGRQGVSQFRQDRHRATREQLDTMLARIEDTFASIPRLDVKFTVSKTWQRSAWEAINLGWITWNVADIQEDGWYIFVEDDWLYAQNLQFNYLIYKVRFELDTERIAIAEAYASKQEGIGIGDEFVQELLIWLIDYFLIGDTLARRPVAR